MDASQRSTVQIRRFTKCMAICCVVVVSSLNLAASGQLHNRLWTIAATMSAVPQSTPAVDHSFSFLRQNTSFFEKLPCMYKWADMTKRSYTPHVQLVDCNDQWAYIHIFKAGGTTIQLQCNTTTWFNGGRENPVYLTHSLFTFVRDPIDHFISGFTECASRTKHGLVPTNFSVLNYLRSRSLARIRDCFVHSAPQIEFLLYNNATRAKVHVEPGNRRVDRFLQRIQFVGDMRDMKVFFQARSLPWNDSLVELRHYGMGENGSEPVLDLHKRQFPTYKPKTDFIGLRERLSDSVINEICNFVRIDYCFFDYTPPLVCRDSVHDFCQRTCAPS